MLQKRNEVRFRVLPKEVVIQFVRIERPIADVVTGALFIGRRTRRRIQRAEELLFVSTISSLEIARLLSVGLLELDGELERWIKDSLEALQCSAIEMLHQGAIGAGKFHKDPADRVLVATARERDLTLITADERILGYRSAKTLDARL